MSLGNELGHLGRQGREFDIFCEQKRLHTVPIIISAKLNQIKSRYHPNLMINFEFHKYGKFSDKLLTCQLFN